MRDNYLKTMTFQNLKTIKAITKEVNTEDIFFTRAEQYQNKKMTDCKTTIEQVRFEFEKFKAKSDENNCGKSMELFLDTLQKYLVAKHNFPNELFRLPREVFFDCLFDALLGVENEWKCYNYYFSTIELSLDDAERIIDSSNHFLDYNQELFTLMQYSSYSYQMPIVFLLFLRFKQEKERETEKDTRKILTALTKLFTIHTLNYYKSNPEVDVFFDNLTKFIMSQNATKGAILKKIKERIDNFKASEDFKVFKKEKLYLSKCCNETQANILRLLSVIVLQKGLMKFANTRNNSELIFDLIHYITIRNSFAVLREKVKQTYCIEKYDLANKFAEEINPRWSKKSAAEREAELADYIMNYLFSGDYDGC